MRIRTTTNHMARLQNHTIGHFPNSKIDRFHTQPKSPTTLKHLRSLLGSVHQLIKFIPNLANLLNLIRPKLKNRKKIN